MNGDEIEILEYLRRFDSGQSPLRQFDSSARVALLRKGFIETGTYFGSWRITDDGRQAAGEARALRHARIAKLRQAEANRDPEAVRASLDEMDAADRCSEFYVPRTYLETMKEAIAAGPRNPAGSLFRPWNRPETLAKIKPSGESPSRCAPTRTMPTTGT